MNPIIPKTNSAPGAGAPASLYLGELASNRTTGKLYLGCDSGIVQIAGTVVAGSAVSTFSGTGSATVFAPLNGYNGTDVGAYMVSVGGIDQRPTTDWTISSANDGTITFASAPPNGAPIVVRAFVGTGTTNGNAAFLQGRAIASTEPAGGEAIIWDSTTSTWKPGTPPSGSDIGGRAWDAAATYTQGDLVATSQREAWICIQNDNANHDPTEAESAWWAPLPADAISLQLRPVATTAPTDGQSLIWDETNTQWKPTTLPSLLGVDASRASTTNVAIGNSAHANAPGTGCVSIGTSAVSEQACVSIGFNSSCLMTGVAIGDAAYSFDGIAIGQQTNADSNGIAIGKNITAGPNEVKIGTFDLGAMKTKINEIIAWANNAGAGITPL